MPLEVELKFVVSSHAPVETALAELNATPLGLREEVDLYFAHPARNFAETDEALRIRRVNGHFWITYKGPKLDAVSKTRVEIDLPLTQTDDTWNSWKELLQRLGFRPVAEVHKRRRKFQVLWEGYAVEVSLDEVANLGTFVELEVVCDEGKMMPVRDALLELASKLKLEQNERRSYLELLLTRRNARG